MGFQTVLKSGTFNDLEAYDGRYFALFHRPSTSMWLNLRHMLSASEM